MPLSPGLSMVVPMLSDSMSRNSHSRATHCSSSGRRWTSTSVERAREAISAVAITVLPAPGGATRTPMSCLASALTAACWPARAPAERCADRLSVAAGVAELRADPSTFQLVDDARQSSLAGAAGSLRVVRGRRSPAGFCRLRGERVHARRTLGWRTPRFGKGGRAMPAAPTTREAESARPT